MALTTEQYEQLPDFVKGDYEKDGDTYRPVAEGKLGALKGSLNELDGKYRAANTELQEFKTKGQLAQEAAEAAALERLKKEGKTDEIVADLTRRHGETIKERDERIAKMAMAIKTKERSLIVGDVAKELKIFDDSGKLFSKMVQDRIDVDPETGKITFLDESGGATSLDKAGFIAELAKDAAYDRLRQAAVSTGGNAIGNLGPGGGAAKKPHEYSDAERIELFRTNPAKFRELFPTS